MKIVKYRFLFLFIFLWLSVLVFSYLYWSNRTYKVDSNNTEMTSNTFDKKDNTQDQSQFEMNNENNQYSGSNANIKKSEDPLKVSGEIVYWDYDNGLNTVKENIQNFSSIGLFWYKLDENGNIEKYINRDISNDISVLQQNNIDVYFIISNGQNGDMLKTILKDSGKTQNLISNIFNIFEENNIFNGVLLNFEFVPADILSNYKGFLKELKNKLNMIDKKLIIFVNYSAVFNSLQQGDLISLWSDIGMIVDEIRVMALDNHYPASHPGSLVEKDWLVDLVKSSQKLFTTSKLCIVLPLYGYDWSLGTAKSLQYNTIINIQGVNGFDEVVYSPYKTYTKGLVNHTIWYEDSKSISYKINLCKNEGIQRFDFFRLGSDFLGEVFDLEMENI